MLFSLICNAISSAFSTIDGTSSENTSMFGSDFTDIEKDDTTFGDFDIGLGFLDDDFSLF